MVGFGALLMSFKFAESMLLDAEPILHKFFETFGKLISNILFCQLFQEQAKYRGRKNIAAREIHIASGSMIFT